MRFRNIFFIVLLCLEIGLLLFLAIKKSNHTLPGYIALGATVLLAFASGWLMLFPRSISIDPTGPHQIETASVTMVDESRIETYSNNGEKRSLEVKFWYPKDAQESSCPLIVFSHGSFGNVNNNETLMKELASRGYVSASIGYAYMASEVAISSKTIKMSSEFRDEVMRIDAEKNKEEAIELYSKWMSLTTKDASFVIDSIKAKNEGFYSLIDKSKICVMGHSFGGSTSLALGRVRNDIYCVIALESPFMHDVKGIKDNKYIFDEDEYPTRMLNVYSDSSFKKLGEWDQYAQNFKYLNKNDPKYQSVHLSGMGHMHLCDFQLVSPFLSWVLSGTDSSNTAKKNLKMVNQTVLDYFGKIGF